MKKAARNEKIIKERQKGMTYLAIGQKHHISAARVAQITTAFYEKLPRIKATHRVRRVVLTKDEVARKLHIPAEKLELRV